MNLVRYGEEWNLQNTVWCEGGIHLAEIGTKNFREDELNTRLGYSMVRHENWQNNCTRRLIGDKRVLTTICSDEWTVLGWYGLDSMSLKCSMSFKCWE